MVKTKVLAVDDEKDVHEMYGDLLLGDEQRRAQYDLRTAVTTGEAVGILQAWQPDIVILDINIGSESGFEICRLIRETPIQQGYVGIVFITGDSSSQTIARGLEMGADDFCSKIQTSIELLARINTVIRIKRMADTLRLSNEKLKAANERLAKLTIRDELSKLYNMRYFHKRLKQEFLRAQRYKKNLSLIMFDLDHFKRVNDTCDHMMGSFVLAEIGGLVAKSIRKVDIAARFGGDEYVVMLPETGEAGARILADRIGATIASTVFDNGIYQVQLTASIGISTLGPHCAEQFKNSVDLIRTADRYLYQAKDLGRGRVVDLNGG